MAINNKPSKDIDYLKIGDSEIIKLDSSSIKNVSSLNALGPIDYLLDNERFKEYKNKNTITIRSLAKN